jgi:class 3 adenylate cyclase
MATERVERMLAAILAADVAGYSRLMGADEEGTLARLKALRRELTDPKIKEYRGRIVKTMGDGLLLEFASVVDAVRYAVDVQREMAERNADVPPDRRIDFRMGINVGDIIKEWGIRRRFSMRSGRKRVSFDQLIELSAAALPFPTMPANYRLRSTLRMATFANTGSTSRAA